MNPAEELKRWLDTPTGSGLKPYLTETCCLLQEEGIESRRVKIKRLGEFKSMIRNELPHESYLEIAMYYVHLGLEEDALRVIEAAPEQATIRYWQAFLLRERSPERSREVLKRAAALSPYLVFPFREESIQVFQWADKALPGDWKAKYYLGQIYWGLRRQEEALKTLVECGNQPDYAPADVSRAWLEKGSNSVKSLADFERARTVDPKDWRNWLSCRAGS